MARANRSKKRTFMLMLLAFCWLGTLTVLAGYKVILKDGKVIEAKTRPVSMEGYYRFQGASGEFQSIPVELVNVEATAAANQAVQSSAPPRVISNDELGSNSSGAASVAGPEPGGAGTQPVEPATGNAKKVDESYFRNRAQQIRSQIDDIDKRIQEINDNVANKKTGGVELQMGATTDYIVTGDYREELRQLEQKKQKLQQDFSALEDEARAAGVPPGVLR